MKLYFSPLACSAATRIALYEAGAEATYVEVNSKTKLTTDGQDYRKLYPLGLVPTLHTDDGEMFSENAAILQYVASRFPHANLAPADEPGRLRLRQWLSFIGTELHKTLFMPLLDLKAPEGAKAYALEKGLPKLAFADAYLTGRQFLLEHFTVAVAYLGTVLNWSFATKLDLKQWPALSAYYSRLKVRPSVAKAFADELALYRAEQDRHKAHA